MRSLILFLALIAFAFGNADSTEGLPPCPRGFQRVEGHGCQKLNATCQCPETPCAFPLKCDCAGGCAAKTCTTQRGCALLRNKLDLCEKAVCQEGQCVAERLTCAGCNPKTGCPGRHHSSTVASVKTDSERGGGGEEDSDAVSVKHDDDDDDDWDHDHDHDHHSSSEPVGWQVWLTIAIFIVIGLLLACIIIYFFSTSSATRV